MTMASSLSMRGGCVGVLLRPVCSSCCALLRFLIFFSRASVCSVYRCCDSLPRPPSRTLLPIARPGGLWARGGAGEGDRVGGAWPGAPSFLPPFTSASRPCPAASCIPFPSGQSCLAHGRPARCGPCSLPPSAPCFFAPTLPSHAMQSLRSFSSPEWDTPSPSKRRVLGDPTWFFHPKHEKYLSGKDLRGTSRVDLSRHVPGRRHTARRCVGRGSYRRPVRSANFICVDGSPARRPHSPTSLPTPWHAPPHPRSRPPSPRLPPPPCPSMCPTVAKRSNMTMDGATMAAVGGT